MIRTTNHLRRSRLQERRAAIDYGGDITPGSGNGWMRKADIHTDRLLVECKTTLKKSYSLNVDTFNKLKYQAIVENKDPIMEIEFAEHNTTLVVMDKNDFLAKVASAAS